MEPVLKFILSAVLTYSTHYGITKIYNFACVPDGITGYLYGAVSMGSPICQAGLQLMSTTQVSYSSLILSGVSRLIIDYIAPGASFGVLDQPSLKIA